MCLCPSNRHLRCDKFEGQQRAASDSQNALSNAEIRCSFSFGVQCLYFKFMCFYKLQSMWKPKLMQELLAYIGTVNALKMYVSDLNLNSKVYNWI